jgi:hypothetical protein
VKIMCQKCNELLDMKDPEQPQIFNTTGMSVLIVEHAKPGFCPNCKTQVAITMVGAQVRLMAAPIAPPKEASVIVMPGSGAIK